MKCAYPIECKNEVVGEHHIIPRIFGGTDDSKNLIPLCKIHHNLVEGFCNKCVKAKVCFQSMFLECFRFEDALPPIHWCGLDGIHDLSNSIDITIKCPICKRKDIIRIDVWDDNIWSHLSTSLFYCHNKHVFYLTMNKEQKYNCIDTIKIILIYYSNNYNIYQYDRIRENWVESYDISPEIIIETNTVKKINHVKLCNGVKTLCPMK